MAGAQLDAATLSGFAPDVGGLPGKVLPGTLTSNLRAQHTFAVSAAGALASTPPTPGDPSAFDADKLLDMLLYLEYRLG